MIRVVLVTISDILHFVGIETESRRCQKVAPGPAAEMWQCRAVSRNSDAPSPLHRLLLEAGQHQAPSVNLCGLCTPQKWLLEPLSWLIMPVGGNTTTDRGVVLILGSGF